MAISARAESMQAFLVAMPWKSPRFLILRACKVHYKSRFSVPPVSATALRIFYYACLIPIVGARHFRPAVRIGFEYFGVNPIKAMTIPQASPQSRRRMSIALLAARITFRSHTKPIELGSARCDGAYYAESTPVARSKLNDSKDDRPRQSLSPIGQTVRLVADREPGRRRIRW